MKADTRAGRIELLEQTINSFNADNKTSYWNKLSDICSKMSSTQLNFVDTNKNVIDKKLQMMEAFNLFLFQKMRDEFVKYPEFEKICDSYIDSIIEALKEYDDNITNILEENRKLKEENADLRKGGYCAD